MNPEEKFDRSIRNIVRETLVEKPSAAFTDNVLGKLGFHRLPAQIIAKPILSKYAKIAIAISYVAVMIILIVVTRGPSAAPDKYLNMLPKFEIPSLNSIFDFSNPAYSLLAVLVGVGWLLILFDKFLKKFFLR